MQPLVELQLEYAQGRRAEAVEALQHLVDANTARADWPARLNALLQLARWRLETNDPARALALMPALAPWLEQQPNAIEMRIVVLRAARQFDAAVAEEAHLARIMNSPSLAVNMTRQVPSVEPAKPAPSAN